MSTKNVMLIVAAVSASTLAITGHHYHLLGGLPAVAIGAGSLWLARRLCQ